MKAKKSADSTAFSVCTKNTKREVFRNRGFVYRRGRGASLSGRLQGQEICSHFDTKGYRKSSCWKKYSEKALSYQKKDGPKAKAESSKNAKKAEPDSVEFNFSTIVNEKDKTYSTTLMIKFFRQ